MHWSGGSYSDQHWITENTSRSADAEVAPTDRWHEEPAKAYTSKEATWRGSQVRLLLGPVKYRQEACEGLWLF